MLFRILIPLLLLLSLPAWGVERLTLSRRLKGWRRLAFYLPNIIVIIAVTITALTESYSASADRWKALLLTVTLCLCITETVTVLLTLLYLPLKRWSGKVAKWGGMVAIAVGFATLCFLVYGFTMGFRQIVVKHFDFYSPEIPHKFDNYRIVQVSDLHLGTLHGRASVVRNIVDSINSLNADLVVFTGDLVNYHAEEAEEFLPLLKKIRGKDGVISIMGNHDYAQYYRWPSPADSLADIHKLQDLERAAGWNLLLNENEIIRREGDSIAIVGVENQGKPPFPALANLPKAQSGLGEGCFKVLLSHDPTHWHTGVLRETDIPLMLSGHTHGMQFKIGQFSPASWFYPEWGGPYRNNSQTLYVSLGVGEVMLPFRLGAWPEINVITLKRAGGRHAANEIRLN